MRCGCALGDDRRGWRCIECFTIVSKLTKIRQYEASKQKAKCGSSSNATPAGAK